MQSLLKNILPFEQSKQVFDKELMSQYKQWDQPSRQSQVALMLFITAMLYLGFIFVDKPWMEPHVESVVSTLFLSINIPLLLLISFCAHQKYSYRWLMVAVAVSPIICVAVHVYVLTLLSENSIYLPEGLLMVLWIFILSGMTFSVAVGSALIVSMMLIFAGYFMLSNMDIYAMYVYWIVCVFAFGVFGALVFERYRKFVFLSQQKLQKLAVTDPLTGIFNRSVFNQAVTTELSQIGSLKKALALIVVDVDHFKQINDTMGHEAGDQVLRRIAEKLAKMTRQEDTLIRWGGEEFVMIATDLTANELTHLCERIRVGIEAESFNSMHPITVSLGATLHRANDTQDSLLIRADNALYQAKDEGRNRFVLIK